jgi:DNA-binding transcriptional LysR family regulator
VDLLRGEADVAIRGGDRPTEGGLVARKITDVAWSVFCSRAYVRRRGCPHAVDELDDHAVIHGEGAQVFLPGVRWLEQHAPNAEVTTRSNRLSNLVVAVKAGLGLAVLPCFVGDGDPDLVRCLPPITELQSAIWLITTEALRDVPRIRAFNDFMAERAAAVRPQMLGLKPVAVAAA